MKTFDLQYKLYGNSAILIEWPKVIKESILDDICIFSKIIKQQNIKGIVDLNFVYCSLLVTYNNDIISNVVIIETLKKIYSQEKSSVNYQNRTWYIPVCYNETFGLDLKTVSIEKGISKEELISLHSSTYYTVFGLGFLPGFLYLGGLKNELISPRKEIPRMHVAKGSIAIGGVQTGIYPQNSPGGWQLIGRTPISMFDSSNEHPTFIVAGDKIKFFPVSKVEFEILLIEVETGIYNIKSVLND